MDKNTLKKFAVWARQELIDRVSQKAALYGIKEHDMADSSVDAIGELVLTAEQKKQRAALLTQISEKSYRQVMEEVAYTWFNRLIALRFMEVNNFLPSHVRVFTDEEDCFSPQILTETIHLELKGLDMERVYALKEADRTEELYQYLLITQCNALNEILPHMFQKIADYTELLLPDNLLKKASEDGSVKGSVLYQMVTEIPASDWKDAVQIIGWLYQYYITELNEQVYDGTLSRSRIQKELLSAATTIYTPDWSVRYMVENSLGRLWVEGHPNNDLKASWKYYLEEAQQEPEVQAQLAEIRKEYVAMKPEEIKCIDPCCGSGHILVYLFDVLVQIYESYGYTTREAVESIVRNNLYGLDIDDRAAQLAYFAVMMKARQYDRRFFSRGIQPNVYAIQESNSMDRYALEYFCNGDANVKAAMDSIIEEMYNAKEYGSILNITPVDFAALYARFDEVWNDTNISREVVLNRFLPLVQVAEALTQKYDVVVTNPPYLGSSRFSPILEKYIKKNYADVKSDLSMVMYKNAIKGFSKKNGFIAFITTSSWMFLSSFEKLRNYINCNTAISSIVDFGTELFDGKVGHNPIVSWVTRNTRLDYKMIAIRLVDYCYSSRDEKEIEFFNLKNRYIAQQSNFSKIPGSPVAYWLSEFAIYAFQSIKLEEKYIARNGITTGQNDLFIRHWYEVNKATNKWFKCNKGGAYRRWYGNQDFVIDWENDGERLKNFKDTNGKNRATLRSIEFNFEEAITMSRIGSGISSFRFLPVGFITEGASNNIYFNDSKAEAFNLLGFLNSKPCEYILNLYNPTINIMPDDLRGIPLPYLDHQIDIHSIVNQCVDFCKSDWDAFETSWDFKIHPLVRLKEKMIFTVTDGDSKTTSYFLDRAYHKWETECENRFNQLKANEEELNRIFIDIYGLQEELTPEVEDKDVTVRKADLQRDIKSLISYAVGCIFGRYSIYSEGLFYAGGYWDYGTKVELLMEYAQSKGMEFLPPALFLPDEDNIIPICDDEYFEDDIVGRFVKFMELVYGKDTLNQNLKFIADALGGKGQPKEVIRNYFLNDFYADHCKIYQKRPIYWLFDSGKKNGFKALIYMHRYQPDTIARIRTDYVHEQQGRYRTAIAELEQRIASATTSERVKLNKQLKKLAEQDAELHTYEEKIHHLADQMISIDLDDGVKVNYAKFQDVLGKIK